MFYHVYIEYFIGEGKNQKQVDCYEKNLVSLDTIRENYVNPFIEGKTIFLSGRIVRPEALIILRILQSEKTVDQLVSDKNNSVPRGFIMIYRVEDLLKGHFDGLKDITNDVINSTGR